MQKIKIKNEFGKMKQRKTKFGEKKRGQNGIRPRVCSNDHMAHTFQKHPI